MEEIELKTQFSSASTLNVDTEKCPMLSTGTTEHPQPAVILVLDPTVDNAKLLEISDRLIKHNVSAFAKRTEKRTFLCLHLTYQQSEELAQKYSYNVRFTSKKGSNYGKCDSPWTKFGSLLQFGSVAYKSFTEVNYSVAYCQELKDKLKPKDVAVLHSVRVQSELIYLILKYEQIFEVKEYKILADFVPHSSDVFKLRKKISWVPQFFPLEEFRDYFGEELSFAYAWSNFWVVFGLIPISFVAFWCLIYGFCTFSKQAHFVTTVFGSKFWDDFSNVMLNPASDFYIAFVLVWISVFQYQWSKAGCILSLQWGVSNYNIQEEECSTSFRQKKFRKYVKNIPDIIISLVGFLVAAASTFLLFIVTEIIFRVNLNKVNFGVLSSSRRIWFISFLCSILYTTLNTLAGVYFIPWFSHLLTSFENHKFQSYYNNSVILKHTGYYLMSSYLYLIYLIFGLNVWLSQRFDIDKGTLSECGEGICFITITQQIVCQILVLRLKSIGKALFQWAGSQLKRKILHTTPNENTQDTLYILENYNTIEFIGSDGNMLWMTERILMYGYIVLFSYHLPIVSLLALVLEVVVTAFELRWLTYSQRPRPRRCNNINQWLGIIYLINIAACIVNAFAVALRITKYQFNNAYETPTFTNVSLIILPAFIFVCSLIHVQGAASGDKVQSHLHAQYHQSMALITGTKDYNGAGRAAHEITDVASDDVTKV